jgi:hypothetical protein
VTNHDNGWSTLAQFGIGVAELAIHHCHPPKSVSDVHHSRRPGVRHEAVSDVGRRAFASLASRGHDGCQTTDNSGRKRCHRTLRLCRLAATICGPVLGSDVLSVSSEARMIRQRAHVAAQAFRTKTSGDPLRSRRQKHDPPLANSAKRVKLTSR